MTNDKIAILFIELADVMEIAGENPFKIRSYRKAAENIVKLQMSISEMSVDDIEAIPGVGKAISEKIQAAIETGTFPALEKWRATGYHTLMPLIKIDGLTPRKLSNLVKRSKIENLDDIKSMVDKGEFQRFDVIEPELKDAILNFILFRR